MPELPEVETIKRQLEKKILDKKIVNIQINNKTVIKEPDAESFKNGIVGETVTEVIRRAKLLIIKFKEDKFLIIHLRISGWLLYGRKEDKSRVAFELSDGNFLNYMDQRMLGELKLRRDYKDLKFIKSLGPEPFDISLEEFAKILKAKKTKIKPLLMDQTVIAGMGNIYAQEALFAAQIDPTNTANNLNQTQVANIYKAMLLVLNEGIKYKGSSVDIYRNLEGDKGGMEKRLKVYGRENKPCVVCKEPIKKTLIGGRGTCFCPNCQK